MKTLGVLLIGVPALAGFAIASATSPQSTQPATTRPAAAAPSSVREQFRVEAAALRPLCTSALAQEFLSAVNALPSIEPRTLHRDKTSRQWMTDAQAAALTDNQRANLEARAIDERVYYQTKYGSPLAYARAIELLGQKNVSELAGKKFLDFGYGTIGHLRMMASRGAQCVGLDVDSFLTALYSEPSDTGVIAHAQGGPDGSIALVNGRFADEHVRKQVGDGFDIILSKNTLKRGYIHPEPPEGQTVDERMLINLGVSDEIFVQTMFELLKPGGKMLIYNLCPAPAPADKPYIPWADGRCPFDRALLEKSGFLVLAFDQVDDDSVRAMAKALKWDTGAQPMNVDSDLFAWYTLLERPAK